MALHSVKHILILLVAFYEPIGCVGLSRYCGKMNSRYFFCTTPLGFKHRLKKIRIKRYSFKLVPLKVFVFSLFQENILLRQRGQSAIKVIDFGSSCYEHQRGTTLNIIFIDFLVFFIFENLINQILFCVSFTKQYSHAQGKAF